MRIGVELEVEDGGGVGLHPVLDLGFPGFAALAAGDVPDIDSLGGAAAGKDPVIVQDTTGFIVNRLLTPYMLSAIRLLEMGTGTIADIDHAFADTGTDCTETHCQTGSNIPSCFYDFSTFNCHFNPPFVIEYLLLSIDF